MAVLIQDSFTGTPNAKISSRPSDVGGYWAGPSNGTVDAGGTRANFCNDQHTTKASSFNCYAQAQYIADPVPEWLGVMELHINNGHNYLKVQSYNNQVYLNATLLGALWASGSVYKIERSGDTVNAYKDGALIGSVAAAVPHAGDFDFTLVCTFLKYLSNI